MCHPPRGDAPDACIRTSVGANSRRIAPAPGDDSPLGWSPDGQFILIRTDRFSESVYNHDIAVVNVATGEFRNLSRDPYLSTSARWSPDGTRIAYASHGPAGDSLHVVTFAGERITAMSLDGESQLAWSPDGRLLAVLSHAAARAREAALALFEPDSARAHGPVLRVTRTSSLAWSPDGRRLIVSEHFNRERPSILHVLHRNAGSVEPEFDIEFDGELRGWIHDRPAPFLDRLEAGVPGIMLEAGETFRLPIAGHDVEGGSVPVRQLTLRSAQPDVAGWIGGDTLVARAPGRATIVASAGGWRTASAEIAVVAAPDPVIVLDEDWSRGIDPAQWTPFGEPAAGIVRVDEGTSAMRNNGDSFHPSGLVTTQAYETLHGLAIEWWQSSPLTGDFWQEIWTDLTDAPLDAFHAGPGVAWYSTIAVASARTPLLERQPPSPIVGLRCAGLGDPQLPFGDVFQPGAQWQHVILQLYPSGGCDLAVNGTIVQRVRPAGVHHWPARLRLAVGGRSNNTDMLIGRVRVWQGMRLRHGQAVR